MAAACEHPAHNLRVRRTVSKYVESSDDDDDEYLPPGHRARPRAPRRVLPRPQLAAFMAGDLPIESDGTLTLEITDPHTGEVARVCAHYCRREDHAPEAQHKNRNLRHLHCPVEGCQHPLVSNKREKINKHMRTHKTVRVVDYGLRRPHRTHRASHAHAVRVRDATPVDDTASDTYSSSPAPSPPSCGLAPYMPEAHVTPTVPLDATFDALLATLATPAAAMPLLPAVVVPGSPQFLLLNSLLDMDFV